MKTELRMKMSTGKATTIGILVAAALLESNDAWAERLTAPRRWAPPRSGLIERNYERLLALRLQNIGNQEISVSLVNENLAMCSASRIKPGAMVSLPLCGKNSKIILHDGHNYRTYDVNSASFYEIYWDGQGWGIRDITSQRE